MNAQHTIIKKRTEKEIISFSVDTTQKSGNGKHQWVAASFLAGHRRHPDHINLFGGGDMAVKTVPQAGANENGRQIGMRQATEAVQKKKKRIMAIMWSEAGCGRFFVPTSFSEVFESAELGSSQTVLRHVNTLIFEGRVTLAQVEGIKKPLMLPMTNKAFPNQEGARK